MLSMYKALNSNPSSLRNRKKNPHSEFNSREDLMAEWIGTRVTQSPPQS